MEGHAVILSYIDEEGNYTLINSWGKDWGNKGTFKVKKECLKNGSYFAVYFLNEHLTQNEKDSWVELKTNIKNLLIEMKSIKCPKCKRSAKIEQFDLANVLKCPFDTKCVFKMVNNNHNNEFSFIVEQLLSYDPYTNKDAKMKFNFGFG